MKTVRKILRIQSQQKVEVMDITSEVNDIVTRSGIKEGIALVFPHHTSMAVYVSDSDRSLTSDMVDLLEKLVPKNAPYRHDSADPKRNAHAHLKTNLLGHHILLPVTDGKLDPGKYQTIYCAEFDGQRPKEIMIKICGE
jgi:secondary thiamine-phosphate synthase enzyme